MKMSDIVRCTVHTSKHCDVQLTMRVVQWTIARFHFMLRVLLKFRHVFSGHDWQKEVQEQAHVHADLVRDQNGGIKFDCIIIRFY